MHFLLLVSLQDTDNVYDVVAPFSGETNKLDGFHIVSGFRRGHFTENQEIDRWHEAARERFDPSNKHGLPDDIWHELRRHDNVQDNDTVETYVAREGGILPFAVLHEGKWDEWNDRVEPRSAWRKRFEAIYNTVPERAICLLADCHR